jgi:hypothetical protein
MNVGPEFYILHSVSSSFVSFRVSSAVSITDRNRLRLVQDKNVDVQQQDLKYNILNRAKNVLNVRVAEPFSTSDHNQDYFDIMCKAFTPKQAFNSYDFEHADWSQIRPFLTNIDFFDLFHCDLLPTDRVDSFYSIINTCIDLYVPIKHSVFPGKPRCVRYPPGIRRKLRKKTCAWHIYRSFRTPESLVSYRKIASECKSAIYAFELYRENQLINNGNTGAFFRYANNKFCGRPAVGPLHDSNGSLTSVSIEKAAIL